MIDGEIIGAQCSRIPLSVLNGGYWSIQRSSAFHGEEAVTRQ